MTTKYTPLDSWLKDCEICNVGLCKRIDGLKDEGKSIREAARIMEAESDGLYEAEKIRARYKYYKGGRKPPTQNPLGGIFHYAVEYEGEWPACKGLDEGEGCGHPVKDKMEYDDDSHQMKKVPVDYGLCRWCRKKQLEKEKALKVIAETDKAIEEFENIPVDAKLDAIWNKVLPQIKALLTTAETETAGGSLVGKVEPDTLGCIENLFSALSDIQYAVREESRRPGYS